MSKVAAGKAITEPTQDNACLVKGPRYSDYLPVPARLEVISVTKDAVAVRTIELNIRARILDWFGPSRILGLASIFVPRPYLSLA